MINNYSGIENQYKKQSKVKQKKILESVFSKNLVTEELLKFSLAYYNLLVNINFCFDCFSTPLPYVHWVGNY